MRNLNWRTSLYEYFDTIRRVPYDNDTNNCAQFIANGWLTIRDDDPFAKYRKHKSYVSILRAVKKDGFDNHSDFYASFIPQHLHTSQAKIGDIAIFATNDDVGEAAGWVIGTHVFVLRLEGLTSLPLSEAIKAFAV